MTPTIINAGAVLSFRPPTISPSVLLTVKYQDNWPLQINNGGTLLYTGTGTTDSTYTQTNFNSTGVMDVANSGANFTFNWNHRGHRQQNRSRHADSRQETRAVSTPTCYRARSCWRPTTGWPSAVVGHRQPRRHAESGATATNGEIYNGISNMNGTFNLNGYSTGLTG